MQNCVAEKKRIFKLAEDLKIEALEIIAYLKSEGIEGISAASYVDGERVQDIKDHFSGKKVKKKPAKTEPIAEPKPEIAEAKPKAPPVVEVPKPAAPDAEVAPKPEPKVAAKEPEAKPAEAPAAPKPAAPAAPAIPPTPAPRACDPCTSGTEGWRPADCPASRSAGSSFRFSASSPASPRRAPRARGSKTSCGSATQTFAGRSGDPY